MLERIIINSSGGFQLYSKILSSYEKHLLHTEASSALNDQLNIKQIIERSHLIVLHHWLLMWANHMKWLFHYDIILMLSVSC